MTTDSIKRYMLTCGIISPFDRVISFTVFDNTVVMIDILVNNNIFNQICLNVNELNRFNRIMISSDILK